MILLLVALAGAVQSPESIVNDPPVRIEKIMAFTPAVSSTDGELFHAIQTVVDRHFPVAPLTPSVSTGFTQSHFFRDLGILSYGFDPTVVLEDLQGTVHGNDERVPVESIRRRVRHLLQILGLLVS